MNREHEMTPIRVELNFVQLKVDTMINDSIEFHCCYLNIIVA